jgi:hypothetical protein
MEQVKKTLGTPNRENFMKLADKLFTDVVVNQIIETNLAGKMIEFALLETLKNRKTNL